MKNVQNFTFTLERTFMDEFNSYIYTFEVYFIECSLPKYLLFISYKDTFYQ